MVIASIDLKDGHVVQLKNGKEEILSRDDSDVLIKEFDRFGEVAIIDLDAALGNINEKGETKNSSLVQKLLRQGNVRVGGGVRSVKRAKELISFGAEKIIIGSSAWKNNSLNIEFLEELCMAVGKQRVIISVDSLNGKIITKGWTETTNISLVDGARQAEKYCSELLFTCVEKEGCMLGTDMKLVEELRNAVACRVVVAGGVASVQEIVSLEKIHCDVQLGMALYTGRVSLQDAFIECLNWQKVSLLPVIAQSVNGSVLMQGYANKEAIAKSFETGKLTFFSRTRNTLWTKGETSGNFLQVKKMRADCDRDCILATVVPQGNVCHTGSFTCFSSKADERMSLEKLYDIILERFKNPTPGSYTATLTEERVREKILEEAEELCEDGISHEEVVWELADLFYFISVLMCKENVSWDDVYNELERRHLEK